MGRKSKETTESERKIIINIAQMQNFTRDFGNYE